MPEEMDEQILSDFSGRNARNVKGALLNRVASPQNGSGNPHR